METEHVARLIVVGIKSELRFIEYSRKFWTNEKERELGERIIHLGYTIIDNIEAGYGPIGYEDYEMSVKQYNEIVGDFREK